MSTTLKPSAIVRLTISAGFSLLLAIGCSTSTTSSDQSAATTTVRPSTSPPTTAPATSVAPTTGRTATSIATDSNACALLAPADLQSAGFPGEISPGQVQSKTDDGDRSSTTCSFGISTTNTSSNVLVTYAPNGGDDVFESRLDTFADVTDEIDDLGDRAVYSAQKSSDTMSSLERGYSDLQVVVLKGQGVLEVSAPSALVAKKEMLVALARIAVDRIA